MENGAFALLEQMLLFPIYFRVISGLPGLFYSICVYELLPFF